MSYHPTVYEPWDCDIDTTKAGLERFGRALIETGSRLTDSMTLARPLGRGVSALTRVQVPQGSKERFEEICKPIVALRPPPRITR